MNFSQKLANLEKVIIDSIPEAKEVALNTLLGAFASRIFKPGKASDNSKIGEYSTKPMFTGSKNFRTAGDAQAFFQQKQEWRTLKTKKGNQPLAIVKGGYSEFRTLNKLQNDYVDLEFSGDLKFSIIVGDFNGQKVLGFNSQVQFEKAKGLEKHFKKIIFQATEDESELAREVFIDYLREKVQEEFARW